MVYERLFEIAQQNVTLQKYIKAGNYIKLDKPNLKKTSISTADLPELLLTQSAVSGALVASSSSTAIVATYNFAVTVGSWDLVHLTSELQWGLLTASASWCSELGLLQWNDEKFINLVVLGDVSVGLFDSESNRGIIGWSLNWPLQVNMRLSTSELRNYQEKE